MSAPTVDVVVPIRYADCCDEAGAPRFRLQGRALWDITFDQALAAKLPRRVVIAHDDERFLEHLKDRRGDLALYRRPTALSAPGTTTLDVLAAFARNATEGGDAPDYMMLLEITHPLRPKGIVDELVRAVAADSPDSLVTCHPVRYNFWRRGDGAMSRIVGAGERESEPLFQELVGIGSVFRTEALLTGNPFGKRVDMAPIDRFWATIDIRDPDGLWLAEQYLARVQAKV